MSRVDVVVIGAGLAGLCAAYELSERGFDVVVLEGRSRPGGRVRSVREPFRDRPVIETGGSAFLHTEPNYARHYIDAFALDWYQRVPGVVTHFHFGGVTVTGDPSEIVPGLRSAERARGLRGLVDDYVDGLVGEALGLWQPSASADDRWAFDRLSYADYLARRGASDAAIELIRITGGDWTGEGASHYSALDVLGARYRHYVVDSESGPAVRIVGGNAELAIAFAQRLGDRVRYGSTVTRIERERSHLRVEYLAGRSARSVDGTRVVCAIPLSVLSRVEVEPGLSPSKRRAVLEFRYSSASLVFLQCRARFWGNGPINAQTDLPFTYIWEAGDDPNTNRPVVMAMSTGPHARIVDSLTPADRLDFATRALEAVVPGARAHIDGGISQCWTTQPFSCGAWGWYSPGQMRSLLPFIATPDHGVHFAGEHTAPPMSQRNMQGALASGVRAAAEVAAAIGSDHSTAADSSYSCSDETRKSWPGDPPSRQNFA